jgi:CheY-like chemotaxis protein
MKEDALQVMYKNKKHSPLVLVIDDSNFMRNSIRNVLEGIGCQVICAKDGLEGINTFQKFKPPIVLIDAIMPIMDGFTTCSTMRRMDFGKDTLIYMVTTQTEAKLVERAFDIGFDDYWVKPVGSVFASRMKKIIQKYRAKQKTESVHENTTEVLNELVEARKLQISLLPKTMKNSYLQISHIYSPFDQVSGDFLDYWWNENAKTLHGYIFDVTGHSIASAMQVFSIKTLFSQFFQCGKSCLSPSRILQFVNNEMFNVNKRKAMATAIVFIVDLEAKTLHYSSAGISPFYITTTTCNKIKTRGYPIGFKKDADYTLEHIAIENATEVIFASDGFSEMLNSTKEIREKHDDVAAILIKIIKQGDLL